MWDMIVSVPDRCLSFYFLNICFLIFFKGYLELPVNV